MEGKETPPKAGDIYDPDIPQDPIIIALEVPADPDGATQVSKPSTGETHRYTRVRSQPDTYSPSMTGKRYEYAMTQLDIQGVLNPDTHMFAQEDFYQSKTNVVIAIMNKLSLKVVFKEWGDKAH